MCVYAKGRCFRLYGAVKHGLNNPLLTLEEHAAQNALRQKWMQGGRKGRCPVHPRSLGTLVKTLLCANVHTDEELQALPAELREHLRVVPAVWCVEPPAVGGKRFAAAQANRTTSAPRPRVTEPPTGPFAKEFEEFLAAHRLFKRLREDNKLRVRDMTCNESGQWIGNAIIHAHPLVVCPNNGKAHKGNSTYFHLNMATRRGYFACTAGTCKGANVWGKGEY